MDSSCSNDGHPQDGLGFCNCWGLPHSLVAANQLLSQNNNEYAKGIKELTLDGWFPFESESQDSLRSHPFIRSAGFKAIRPETFKVELCWTGWDFGVLEEMSVTNLKHLKLPISLPSDCFQLGQALTNMPRLVSLAITDIPDREEFVNGLEPIGKGIISCASTLRELDIEMTNFNHLPGWSRDERFVEPKENGFFFRKIFPCPTTEEPSAPCQRHIRVNAPFRLTKLRLKHLSLPWYSFGMVFNATTIREIHLPYSKVDGEVWRVLETHARLDTLTGISYDMLSADFLRFLSQQPSLKRLIFERTQDQCEAAYVTFYGDSPSMTYNVSRYTPRPGPDSEAGYPSLYDCFSSFEKMTMLRYLVLPADICITSHSLIALAASLTGLEYLELAFDYEDYVSLRPFHSR